MEHVSFLCLSGFFSHCKVVFYIYIFPLVSIESSFYLVKVFLGSSVYSAHPESINTCAIPLFACLSDLGSCSALAMYVFKAKIMFWAIINYEELQKYFYMYKISICGFSGVSELCGVVCLMVQRPIVAIQSVVVEVQYFPGFTKLTNHCI